MWFVLGLIVGFLLFSRINESTDEHFAQFCKGYMCGYEEAKGK